MRIASRNRKLLQKAISGSITAGEIDDVARRLRSAARTSEVTDLLHILGEARAIAYANDVAEILRTAGDGLTIKAAFDVFSLHWDTVLPIRDEIEAFLDPHSSDSGQWARDGAITAAGHYIRQRFDRELLQRLIEIVLSPTEEIGTREQAFAAVAHGVGMDNAEWPGDERGQELSDSDVVVAALRLVGATQPGDG